MRVSRSKVESEWKPYRPICEYIDDCEGEGEGEGVAV